MLSYKLAKKLKDAGFSQTLFLGDRFYYSKGQLGLWDDLKLDKIGVAGRTEEWLKTNPELVKIPSLPKLLKECGKKKRFIALLREEVSWRAVASNTRLRDEVETLFSKTSEEAVVELYLKLNK